MTTRAKIECDSCGKLADPATADGETHNEVVGPPKGWRRMPLPFGIDNALPPLLDLCSPGCAKKAVDANINDEWELPEAAPERD